MAELSAVVARLAAQLGPAGELTPLDGGLTNRNFRVRFGDRDCVLRVCGVGLEALGIDRATEAQASHRASELGIGPAVLAHLPDDGVLVCEFLEGTTLQAGDLRTGDRLAQAARLLRTLHESGPLTSAFAVFRLVEHQRTLAAAEPEGYAALLATAARIERAVGVDDVPGHNDLLPANLIDTPAGLRLIDWDYAGMNHRYFDLGNLAVNNELTDADERTLLAAYWDVTDPAPAQRATLKLMRFMSDFREAMWGVAQQTLSTLDEDYAGYARKHFDRLRQTAAHPDFDEWISLATSP